MAYDAISVDQVEVSADSGARVTQVAREALILALSEDRIVFVNFNGRGYTIDPADVLHPIVKALTDEQEEG